MDQEVNLEEKFSLLDKPYSPAIVGYVNDYKLQIVKVEGSSSGHKHDETDDFFLVIRGHPERRFATARCTATTAPGLTSRVASVAERAGCTG